MKDLYDIFLKHFWILLFVLFIWVIHLLNNNFHLNLFELGILPRTIDGLPGIFFAPLIHSASDHNHIITTLYLF
jgi:hypothetical protein